LGDALCLEREAVRGKGIRGVARRRRRRSLLRRTTAFASRTRRYNRVVHTACSDEKGCPLAFYTINTIKRGLEKKKAVRGRVQMVSLSFDPEHDRPEVMRVYAGDERGRRASPVPWYFLTAASTRELAPVLDGFGQDVSKAAGQSDRELMHVLKLFLIDKHGWVREIYTTSYLIPQVVVNDIKTLLIEDGVKVN